MRLALRITVACVTATVTFLGSWWLFAQMPGLDQEAELAAVAASLVLFVVGYWAVNDARRRPGFDLNKVADDLAVAVQKQWESEEERRRVHDPAAMPVRWRIAAEDLADHMANVTLRQVDACASAVLPDGKIERIAGIYQRVPSKRMVVLGRAGSGKTVLASQLALDLLASREPGGVVPVLVSVGSWNPYMSLRRWLAERLARDYPALGRKPRRGGPSLATRLVDEDRILPILDGFDEIADGPHRAALTALNDVAQMPLVVTSRVDEYAAALATADALTGATTVQLEGLGTQDLVDYLPRTARLGTGQNPGVWDEVVARLREADDPAAGVLCEALSTPLLVFLARTVYSDTPGNDPADLLDTTRYPNVEAIERHLLTAFLPAVYRHIGRVPRRSWDSDRAQKWLTFLARHLNCSGTRDIAWWRLHYGVPRRRRRTKPKGELLPRRTLLRARGRMLWMIQALAAWLAIVLVYGLVLFQKSAAGHLPGVSIVAWIVTGIAIYGAAGITGKLAAAADVTEAVHIRDSIAADRISTIFLTLAVGLPLGLWRGFYGFMPSGYEDGFAHAIEFGLSSGFMWMLAFTLGSTAWGRWLISVRLWLPVTGRLPWRVVAFLDDAHRRGVLRQAGAVYQFRHAHLQDYLTANGRPNT